MAKTKRKDNTKRMMRQLEKAAKESVTEAAQKLMLISKKAVSRKYAGDRKSNRKSNGKKKNTSSASD